MSVESCLCCDNLVGAKRVLFADKPVRELPPQMGFLCPGCASPRHRHLTDEGRQQEHEDPAWVAGRLEW